MILIKISLWRQEDTRSVFLKKMKDFWGIKKKKIKMKKIKLIECIKDIKNGVVKRKINKIRKIKMNIRYNEMETLKMVSSREK